MSEETMIKALFTQHPNSVGETYGQHFVSATSFAVTMLCGATVCFAHAFLPFLFQKTGSGFIRKLYERMVTHRVRVPTGAAKGGADYVVNFEI